jgi:hypothetical protein
VDTSGSVGIQYGFFESVCALKDGDVIIDIIKSCDVQQNQAKSWFWQKSKQKPVANEKSLKAFHKFLSLLTYLT